MKCTEVVEQFAFYSYGEVSPEMEELIEEHLAGCPECKAAFAAHRAFMDSLDQRDDLSGSALLTTCRVELRQQLSAVTERRALRHGFSGWMESLKEFSSFHIPFRIPVGALALVACGFFAARYTPQRFGGIEAGLTQPMFSSVKSIQPDSSGGVQIAVDETQRRVISGGIEDPRIQKLLIDAAREDSNPSLRVESIGVLRQRAGSEDIRRALIETVIKDPSAAVRLKALEGLKAYANDSDVRSALANVLLKDENPGIRVQAIDVLEQHADDSIVGILQDVMQKEEDGYIRIRCRDLLQAMKASVDTY